MTKINKAKRLGITLGLWLAVSCPLAASATDSIKSIFDKTAPAVRTGEAAKQFRCPSLATPMLDMSDMFAFYKPDKTLSVIDKTKMKAYVAKTKPTILVVKNLSAATVAALTLPTAAATARDCIVRQTDLWATQGAMLQGIEQNDALGHRQAALTIAWTSIAFANAIQATDGMAPMSPEQRAQLRQWFAAMTKVLEENFTRRPRPPKEQWLDANSNHRFWAGAAVGLMSVETGDRAAFNLSMSILKESMTDIGPDGSMPSEMRRGGKSLHYQNFALSPISIMVSLADANGVRLSDDENKALARAAKFAVSTLLDPGPFEKSQGYKQELDIGMLAWAGLLAEHFRSSDPELAQYLKQQFLSIGKGRLDVCESLCNAYYAMRLGQPEHR